MNLRLSIKQPILAKPTGQRIRHVVKQTAWYPLSAAYCDTIFFKHAAKRWPAVICPRRAGECAPQIRWHVLRRCALLKWSRLHKAAIWEIVKTGIRTATAKLKREISRRAQQHSSCSYLDRWQGSWPSSLCFKSCRWESGVGIDPVTVCCCCLLFAWIITILIITYKTIFQVPPIQY